MKTHMRAFTLIELLIVVAIIAILAAIAVPNFLEAQVRSKVARVKADQRTYSTAIEAYAVDWNQYPPWIAIGASITLLPLEETLIPLSTPIAYLTDALLEEPFNSREGWGLYEGWDVLDNGGPPPSKDNPIYLYITLPSDALTTAFIPFLQGFLSGFGITVTDAELDDLVQKKYYVVSPGPDGMYSFDRCLVDGNAEEDCVFKQVADIAFDSVAAIYDPTNGSISQGEIVRTAQGISMEK